MIATKRHEKARKGTPFWGAGLRSETRADSVDDDLRIVRIVRAAEGVDYGILIIIWDDILPPVPEDVWLANLEIVKRELNAG